MSLEGGREGKMMEGGRGGEGRGGEGREGGRDGERREGRGRGGMTVIQIILMAAQYSYNNDVTYYVIT